MVDEKLDNNHASNKDYIFCCVDLFMLHKKSLQSILNNFCNENKCPNYVKKYMEIKKANPLLVSSNWYHDLSQLVLLLQYFCAARFDRGDNLLDPYIIMSVANMEFKLNDEELNTQR